MAVDLTETAPIGELLDPLRGGQRGEVATAGADAERVERGLAFRAEVSHA
jgi:hypothetical protein